MGKSRVGLKVVSGNSRETLRVRTSVMYVQRRCKYVYMDWTGLSVRDLS